MPINTNLNVDPYFDDYNLEKQYYKVLFKPSYAVQSRELTQLQTILQNQVEQLGDHLFKEGSIVKGCNFFEFDDLNFVKVTDKLNFDVTNYVGYDDTVEIGTETFTRENTFELRGDETGVHARIVAATRGFETRNPDLNTFYINYINTSGTNKTFRAGENLEIYRISNVGVGENVSETETLVGNISVTTFPGAIGDSYAVRSAPGIIFQKGHFLYSDEQLVIVSKYTKSPDNMSIGFTVEETLIDAFEDETLYDNANGSFNQNAPGADRLKLTPILTAIPTDEAKEINSFFTLIRYQNGNAVTVRDVAQYNVLGEEMARRTFEESGDYIVQDFKTNLVRRNGQVNASIGSGTAYVKGYRVSNKSELFLPIDEISETSVEQRSNQAVSFNYGGYFTIKDQGTPYATVDLYPSSSATSGNNFNRVSLKNATDTLIGYARAKNLIDDKLYVYDIDLLSSSNKVSDVKFIGGVSSNFEIDGTATISAASTSPMVFKTGAFGVKSLNNASIPARAVEKNQPSGNQFTITPNPGEDFNLTNFDVVFIDGTGVKLPVTSASQVGNNLVVNLGAAASAGGTIYYNKRIVNALPFSKVSEDLFVRVSFSPNDELGPTKFNLGFPDVYEIISITDSSNGNVTDSFRLKTNQKDNYYDHSYIEYIPGRPVPSDGTLIVSMKVFRIGTTGGRNYYFNADSYPSDIPVNKIQPYRASSGNVYNLNECLDFRLFVSPISGTSYAAASSYPGPNVGNSSTGVNLDPVFTVADSGGAPIDPIIPAINEFAQVDYEFYLNRTDSVTIDSYGLINIVKGTESEYSQAAPVTGNQLKIAEIYVPGRPALTPEEAASQDRANYGIKVKRRGTKTYRMKDIENLENKIDSLKYYVLLSSLEAETQNLNILDANGLSRFKNGIIVDPFNDLSIANVRDSEFNAAIDFTERSLMPAVKAYPLKMKYKTSSNASIFPSTALPQLATLQRNSDIAIISQEYATDFRNCVSDFWSFKGSGELSPEYDALYDTVTNPANIDIDIATPITQLFDTIQEFMPLTSTRSDVLSVGTVTAIQETPTERITASTTTTRIRDTRRTAELNVSSSEQVVGDFVSNFTFNPYMRGRDVKVYMAGLRPNTLHYFYFDREDVTDRVCNGGRNLPDTVNSIQRNGQLGGGVYTDSQGVLRAVFALPEATFYVGDRNLEIADVDTYNNIEDAATSYGMLTYRAYNFSVEKSRLTVSTRTAETSVRQTETLRTVTTRTLEREQIQRGGGKDPIAQTFVIKQGMGQGSDTVFASKIDLYFKKKSTRNGVTVELREVENGYPSYNVIPFSKVHLTPAQVSTSDDASVATTVIFKAPVRLDTEKEYAFVVIPDASDPDYLIFTSKVGNSDLTPGVTQGKAIVQDWGDGVLFTSTNGRAWQSYQDEDIKFNFYRHNFSASTGSVTVINDDHEFLKINNISGRFAMGELVYSPEAIDEETGSTVSTISNSNEITGQNLSTTYNAGDKILVTNAQENKQIVTVVSANTTAIIADTTISFTDTVLHFPVTTGIVSHYDTKYPGFIILQESNASAVRKWEAGDDIIAFDSSANARVDTVENKQFSYIQPMIYRTNDSVTTTTLSGTYSSPLNSFALVTKGMQFNDKTTFNKDGLVIYSKSNDPSRSRGFNLTVNMTNGNNVTSSPIVDLETVEILAYEWKITNDSATTSKYISQTVELAESLDAEDMEVFVTAYRPTGTRVKVYIKPQAANDPTAFDTNEWIELELYSGLNTYSADNNINDFREFAYRVSESEKSNEMLSYSNSKGLFEGYRRFAIKIELLSENIFKAPRLLDYRGIALT